MSSARNTLRSIAESTLATLITGSYVLYGKRYQLHIESSKQGTRHYAPDSLLSQWSLQSAPSSFSEGTDVSFLEGTTIQGVHAMCSSSGKGNKLGVLNFASAHRPGGGFMTGAQAQEESIARSSTLYPTLYTESAQRFYNTHKKHPNFYYTHAMVYSPRVHIFRDDQGHWTAPFVVDVLTSAAVNAGEVRAHAREGGSAEKEIEGVMRERMARILYLFELQGAKILVLGSFGTGVFRNEVSVVARIWAELLSGPHARFRRSFDRVLFAIIDKKTLGVFEHAFRQGSSGAHRHDQARSFWR